MFCIFKGDNIKELEKKIEFLGGIRVSSWSISCSLYLERLPDGSPNAPREFHLLTFDEKIKKSYMVSQYTVVEADREVVSILEKTNSYKKRQTHEISGSKYEIGDFIIRIGPIVLNADVKAIAVEVEYTACSVTSTSPFNASKLLSEFISGNLGFPADQVQTSYDFSAFPALPRNYSELHTSIQYVNLFKSLGSAR
ncbi:putative mediator complex subunit 20 [Heterostelium album PN500]|uniref:Mediator of RNA polymerase II transcription subunit 20 n=1 Tax=Heterostelium pallidum (strain ATCC 26659 / Pp 5 / PN500) TaxID=670386 RepID=D3B2Y3_HETP5|nr:putative mediator complex subunit 20 [Heterostelium album PN500]EFA83681.1 putative mediator complex subunit 20 [Heterostelium album PN500]|eukprot:XP_020435798.1 putative mediator complex subunit 20 [Heterostelium album PN500]